jgi:hypothetical protein
MNHPVFKFYQLTISLFNLFFLRVIVTNPNASIGCPEGEDDVIPYQIEIQYGCL